MHCCVDTDAWFTREVKGRQITDLRMRRVVVEEYLRVDAKLDREVRRALRRNRRAKRVKGRVNECMDGRWTSISSSSSIISSHVSSLSL